MTEVLDLMLALWPLLAIQLGVVVWALVDLIRRKEVKHLPKGVWAILIIINIIGAIAYLIVGRGEA